MATNTIRLSDGVKEETCRIAGQMGLTFNSVVNILLKKFNETKGFPFPVVLENEQKSVFDMSTEEFMVLCRQAVEERDVVPQMEYVTTIDEDTGLLVKKYWDGRVEYVIE